MHSIIAGAGIGGLSAAIALGNAGHKVTVFEAAPEFKNIGAGIHLAPNCVKLLERWGVELVKRSKKLDDIIQYKAWKSGDSITCVGKLEEDEDHGAPYILAHRADLHDGLYGVACKAGAEIHLNSAIIKYDYEAPSVTLADGTVHEADFIVAADGIKSTARSGIVDDPGYGLFETGKTATRIVVSSQHLLKDPDLAHLLDSTLSSVWCGPGVHIVGYPIRNNEMYNIAICESESVSTENDFEKGSWVTHVNPIALQTKYACWNKQITKLLSIQESPILKFKMVGVETSRWVHPSGKVVLLGDSCHAMLPTMAQAGAQAIEDAAALGQIMQTDTNNNTDDNSISDRLFLYQSFRMSRIKEIQLLSREKGRVYQLPDGPEQEKRDQDFLLKTPENPCFFGCRERREWLFGFDAEAAAREFCCK